MSDRKTALLTRDEVAERLNVCKSTTYQLLDLPAPIRLGRYLVRWEPGDIDQYITKRKAAK